MVGDPGEDAHVHFKQSRDTYQDFVSGQGDVELFMVENRIRLDIQLVQHWDSEVDLPVASRLGDLPPAKLEKMVASLVDSDYLSPELMNLLNRSMKPLSQHKQLYDRLAPIRQWVAENSDTSDKENEEIEESQDTNSSVKGLAKKAEKKVEIVTDPAAKDNTKKSRGIYTYVFREIKRKPRDQPCFVCKGSKKGALLTCEGKTGGKHCCSTRFHEACIKAYNAGDFDFEYLREVTGKAQCPLHFCSVCFQERRKSSAITGKMISCDKCYRAFHMECMPATVAIRKEKIDNDVLAELITCHAHLDLTAKELTALLKKSFPVFSGEKGKRFHLPFCCECEQTGDKATLAHCTNCIRSFHPDCHSFGHYIRDGTTYHDQALCEGCLYGEYVRVGQKCIARFQNSFFPCTAVAVDGYPAHCAPADKYGSYLGRPGFIAVMWGGCQNLFSMMPPGTVVPMFTGSYALIGKRMSDPDHADAWKEMAWDCEPPKPDLPCNDNYTSIKSSIPFGDCKNLKIPEKLVLIEAAVCDCKEGQTNRCGPGSTCCNRAFLQECPKDCEEKGGGCGNRSISNKQVHPNIERKEAKGKGYGVFATAPIQNETVIGEYAGELLTVEEKNRRIELSKKSRNDEEMHYMMGLDSQRTIDCRYKGNIARFLNHSCEPNCKVIVMNIVVGTKTVNKEKHYVMDVRVAVQAIRDIQPGEELCFNYRMDSLGEGVDVPNCYCNAPSCSGKLSKEAKKNKKEAAAEEKDEVDGGSSKKKGAAQVSTPKQSSTSRSAKKTSEKKAQQSKEHTPVVKKEDAQKPVRSRSRALSRDVAVPVHVTKGKAVAIPFKSEVRDEDDAAGNQFFPSSNKKAAIATIPKIEVKEEEDLQLHSPDSKRRRVTFEDEVVVSKRVVKEEPKDEDEDGAQGR